MASAGSRRAFFRTTGTAAAVAAGLVLVPGVAAAAPGRQPDPGPGAWAGVPGVDPYTGEPLDAGPDCDRGFK